jgi:Leucine-rich repeat (LRR) protein
MGTIQTKMNDANLALFYCHHDEDDNERGHDKRILRERLDLMGIRYKSIHVGSNGVCGLNLSGTRITDLSPLKEFLLTHLCLQDCFGITDFSPLKDMGLTWLNLCRTNVTDLSSLGNLPLSYLKLYRTQTANLSPLGDMPLRSLDIRFTKVTDVSPLRCMPLQELSFFPTRVNQGMHVLRGMESLKTINRRPAEEFWKRHDS